MLSVYQKLLCIHRNYVALNLSLFGESRLLFNGGCSLFTSLSAFKNYSSQMAMENTQVSNTISDMKSG